MRPRQTWESLAYRTQAMLFRNGDPRVPAGWKPNPVGRPRGTPQSAEARARMSLTHRLNMSAETKERKLARAIKDLIALFGSMKEAMKHLKELK